MRPIATMGLILLVWSATPLAAAHAPSPSVGRWTDLQKLRPATEVIVTVGGAGGMNHTFVFADPAAIFVLNTATLAQAGEAERDLREIVIANAAVLAVGTQTQFVRGNVRVDATNVFVAGHKIADVSDLVQRLDRADVVEVRLTRSRRRSSIAAASATGAAIGAGVGLALSATVFGCHGACAEDWTRGLVLAGTGIGAGVGASIAAARPKRDERVIYSVA